MQKNIKIGSIWVVLATMALGSAHAQTTSIPASSALPSSAADTSKPGFLWRMSQVDSVGNYVQNSLDRTEAQLAGLLGPNVADPTVAGIATGPASPPNPSTAPIEFVIPGVLNVSKTEGTSLGNFTPDDQMPGSPGTGATPTDNQAAEVLTYLDLPAGDITMGVNSDDGFRLSIGGSSPSDHFAVTVGEFNNGRGAGDTIFKFHIDQAGLYSARLIWENGGGDSNIEWFSVLPDGTTDVLINDVATPGAIKAYRAVTTPAGAYASAFSPGPNTTTVSPDAPIHIVLVDGPTPIAPATVKLAVDGSAVAATVGKTNNATTINYSPAAIWPSASSHNAQLVYSDTGTPAHITTNNWTFKVITYRNIVLPTPIYFEDFEKTALGAVPTGWKLTNNTDSLNAGLEIGDPKSDSYLDWVVIDRNQVFINGTNDFHVWEAGDPDGRVTHIAPGQIVNGVVLTAADLMVGKFLYAESDERGSSQEQTAFSPIYDLTGKTNIWLSFHSSYIQNQDSIGVVEYSIDGGTSWLPVLYMLDGPDVVYLPDGKVDAVTTFTQDQSDTAHAQPYGAFLGAPISQDLAPYISPRVNDDSIESHRVELYPLPKADNQSKVQLRFLQAGTGSWYFGIDDVGIYSMSSSSSGSGNPAELGQSVNGFQDDFKGATRDPNWVAVGPGGDHYVQTNGVLQVSAAQGDPNHLIYMGVGASNNVQEVLARMRVVGFGANNDGPRGGVAVGVNTNVTGHIGAWIGANINFRDFTGDVAGGTTRHFRMLDDNRAWGPQLNTVWTNNVWYWTRLRVEPKADGTNDYFGKVWLADGSTPEPSDWQLKWPDAGTGAAPTPLHAGWAGITGCSSAALGQTEVDYVLIKSATLPSITVNFDAQGPAVNPPVIHSIVHSGNNAVVDWFGGTLQSGLAVTGPWLNVANTPSPTTNSVATATAAKFFRVAQ